MRGGKTALPLGTGHGYVVDRTLPYPDGLGWNGVVVREWTIRRGKPFSFTHPSRLGAFPQGKPPCRDSG